MPELDCREAAVYVGVTWQQWLGELTADERAYAVAHYRVNLLLKAHVDDASRKRQEAEERRAQRRSASARK